MSKIVKVIGREILDSRGNPTVEVDVITELGNLGRASVPSGASTGSMEALELRDNDNNRYLGKGVLKAVNNINNSIRQNIIGLECTNQRLIDEVLINLDGSNNKSNLGANAILGVSLATIKAGALDSNLPLYKYIGDGKKLPCPMMNIINGGAHSDNTIDFQEFMIIPNKDTFSENLRIGTEVFHTLKKILNTKKLETNVGDEGGFAPNLKNTKEALDLIIEAIKKAGYIPEIDINIGLDVAASEFYDEKKDKYILKGEDKELTKEEMIDFYEELVNDYPIISIEDGLNETDIDGWEMLTTRLGDKIQLVGDDLFVTNEKLLREGIENNIANAILLKVNQIGTVSETINCINLAKEAGYKTIISHRSGETEDNYIADIAVGLNLGQIKTGSLSRSDRISKYNQLLRIEEEINN